TPPFGFALFYLRGVAPPSVKTIQMYKGVIAFISLQLLALVIVGLNPPLVNYLPNRVSLTSETAPPPINPRLQHCLETQVFARYDTEGDRLRAAIARAGTLDLSVLPDKERRDLEASLASAARTFELVDEVRSADAAVVARMDAYKPLHREVRFLEGQIRRLQTELAETRQRLDRLSRNPDAETGSKSVLEERAVAIESQIETLRGAVPSDWAQTSKAFSALTTAEVKARRQYRANVDQAYTPVAELIALLDDAAALAALQPEFERLARELPGLDPQAASARLDALSDEIGALEGTSRIRSRLSRARRELRGDRPDLERAVKSMQEGLERYETERQWRSAASGALLAGLREYEVAIRDTIGVRQQRRLPREQAIEIASCTAVHRDISLNF
ncbi:MAG: TRAP transporter large permease subunit, partial [Gammaproteobacteria bacterium]|nr:TRAP transporter large permease subunit [Gammaproteobacteria bacterium]